jgi:hypothetical protein
MALFFLEKFVEFQIIWYLQVKNLFHIRPQKIMHGLGFVKNATNNPKIHSH